MFNKNFFRQNNIMNKAIQLKKNSIFLEFKNQKKNIRNNLM